MDENLNDSTTDTVTDVVEAPVGDPTLDSLVQRVTDLKAEKEQAEEANRTLTEQITALQTNLREAQYARNLAERNAEERIIDGLKAAVSEGTIDIDTAKTLASDNFDVDPDALVPSFSVQVTITVTLSGVKGEDEDAVRDALGDNFDVTLGSYSGVEYDDLTVDDVSVDNVDEE